MNPQPQMNNNNIIINNNGNNNDDDNDDENIQIWEELFQNSVNSLLPKVGPSTFRLERKTVSGVSLSIY